MRYVPIIVVLTAVIGAAVAADEAGPKVTGLSIDGNEMALRRANSASVSHAAQKIQIRFGELATSGQAGRVRYRLDGIDDRWREGPGEMFVTVRFFDERGDQVGQQTFSAMGESPGWNLDLERANFTYRREVLVAPPQAASLWVVMSSAGPPATLGLMAVERITISPIRPDGSKMPPIFNSPRDGDPSVTPGEAEGWVQDGTRPRMARRVAIGATPPANALAIVDDDPLAHAEWHNTRQNAPRVTAGDRLLVEWTELFSIGIGNVTNANYEALPPGDHRFRLQRLTVEGKPVGAEGTFVLEVVPPFWRTTWFWVAVVISGSAAALGLARYAEWRRVRRQFQQFERDRLVEQERMRIARDIHDDLGARATHISLLSSAAEEQSESPEAAQRFNQITTMTRELIAALYQTVWTVSPENDNLTALGDYLCQIASRQCEAAGIRCRLNLSGLSASVDVSSQLRHHLTMVVSEAIHNAVKHSHASEIALSASLENSVLTISIQDQGGGFNRPEVVAGHGLENMRQRIDVIGGTLEVESSPGKGTSVTARLPM